MQDLSVVGHTIAVIADQEVKLEGYAFEDLGTLQGEVVRDRRRAKLQTGLELREILGGEAGEKEFDKVRAEAEKIVLTEKDLEDYLQTPNGVSTLLWILVERQYPQRFTRKQILKSLTDGQLTEEKVLELVETLRKLQQIRGNG